MLVQESKRVLVVLVQATASTTGAGATFDSNILGHSFVLFVS
jgi:hypothetical protein